MAKGLVTQGCVVEIGIVNGTDKGMIVMPMINMATPLLPLEMCAKCALSVINEVLPLLADCMSVNAYIGMLHVRGMVPGRLPYNDFFAVDDYPGTLAGDAAPNQVSANVNFYADPSDYSIGNVLRIAKNFVFGIPELLLTNSVVQQALQDALQALADKVIEGITGTDAGTWKRVMRTVKMVDGHADTDDEIPLAILAQTKDRVRTQKRRLKPDW